MNLVDKLEKRATELDRKLSLIPVTYFRGGSSYQGGYDMEVADDRELLEQAAKRIRELEFKHHYV